MIAADLGSHARAALAVEAWRTISDWQDRDFER